MLTPRKIMRRKLREYKVYKEEYKELIASNPLRKLRESANLSQAQLAEYANITVQYVYRNENGLVNTPSSTIIEILIDENSSDATVESVVDSYYGWVSAMRAAGREALLGQGNSLLKSPYTTSGNQKVHPFRHFIWNYNSVVGRRLLGSDAQIYSEQQFNRLLCVHPRAVQQYLRRTSDPSLPRILTEALEDVGFYTIWQEPLEHEVKIWLSWQKDAAALKVASRTK